MLRFAFLLMFDVCLMLILYWFDVAKNFDF